MFNDYFKGQTRHENVVLESELHFSHFSIYLNEHERERSKFSFLSVFLPSCNYTLNSQVHSDTSRTNPVPQFFPTQEHANEKQ